MERASSLGPHLGRLRDERGWSLREAGKRAEVHFSRLREWESGFDAHTGKPVTPPREALLRLARVYGVAPEPLLALAGYRTERDPTPDEERLLAAFRQLPEGERRAVLAEVEARASGPGRTEGAGPAGPAAG